MNAPIKHVHTADEIDPAIEVFASWSRVIAGAPIENRPVLFGMMASDAATWADAIRQQAIDDMWWTAGEMGLVDLIGTTTVQAAIAVAFDRGAARARPAVAATPSRHLITTK